MMKGGYRDETMAHTPVRTASCCFSGGVYFDTTADNRDNSSISHQWCDNRINNCSCDNCTDHDDSHNCNHGYACCHSDRTFCDNSRANHSSDGHTGANRSADSNTGSDNCTDNL